MLERRELNTLHAPRKRRLRVSGDGERFGSVDAGYFWHGGRPFGCGVALILLLIPLITLLYGIYAIYKQGVAYEVVFLPLDWLRIATAIAIVLFTPLLPFRLWLLVKAINNEKAMDRAVAQDESRNGGDNPFEPSWRTLALELAKHDRLKTCTPEDGETCTPENGKTRTPEEIQRYYRYLKQVHILIDKKNHPNQLSYDDIQDIQDYLLLRDWQHAPDATVADTVPDENDKNKKNDNYLVMVGLFKEASAMKRLIKDGLARLKYKDPQENLRLMLLLERTEHDTDGAQALKQLEPAENGKKQVNVPHFVIEFLFGIVRLIMRVLGYVLTPIVTYKWITDQTRDWLFGDPYEYMPPEPNDKTRIKPTTYQAAIQALLTMPDPSRLLDPGKRRIRDIRRSFVLVFVPETGPLGRTHRYEAQTKPRALNYGIYDTFSGEDAVWLKPLRATLDDVTVEEISQLAQASEATDKRRTLRKALLKQHNAIKWRELADNFERLAHQAAEYNRIIDTLKPSKEWEKTLEAFQSAYKCLQAEIERLFTESEELLTDDDFTHFTPKIIEDKLNVIFKKVKKKRVEGDIFDYDMLHRELLKKIKQFELPRDYPEALKTLYPERCAIREYGMYEKLPKIFFSGIPQTDFDNLRPSEQEDLPAELYGGLRLIIAGTAEESVDSYDPFLQQHCALLDDYRNTVKSIIEAEIEVAWVGESDNDGNKTQSYQLGAELLRMVTGYTDLFKDAPPTNRELALLASTRDLVSMWDLLGDLLTDHLLARVDEEITKALSTREEKQPTQDSAQSQVSNVINEEETDDESLTAIFMMPVMIDELDFRMRSTDETGQTDDTSNKDTPKLWVPEYCAVYDAEDRPEADQLLKAVYSYKFYDYLPWLMLDVITKSLDVRIRTLKQNKFIVGNPFQQQQDTIKKHRDKAQAALQQAREYEKTAQQQHIKEQDFRRKKGRHEVVKRELQLRLDEANHIIAYLRPHLHDDANPAADQQEMEDETQDGRLSTSFYHKKSALHQAIAAARSLIEAMQNGEAPDQNDIRAAIQRLETNVNTLGRRRENFTSYLDEEIAVFERKIESTNTAHTITAVQYKRALATFNEHFNAFINAARALHWHPERDLSLAKEDTAPLDLCTVEKRIGNPRRIRAFYANLHDSDLVDYFWYRAGEYFYNFLENVIDNEWQQYLDKAYPVREMRFQQKKQPYYPAHSQIVCLQAKLTYENLNDNWIISLFKADYATWFNYLLPGLHVSNLPIPLGGTSNHFKMDFLSEIGGWDAFNVAEDCDLGMWIARAGKRVAIVESITWEIANPGLKDWIRQRSRWIKGYMQSYFVHMRQPITLWRELGGGMGFGSFQLTVGAGFLLPMLSAPFYVMTLIYIISLVTIIIGSVMRVPVEYTPLFFINAIHYSWMLPLGTGSLFISNVIYFLILIIGQLRHPKPGNMRFIILWWQVYWIVMIFAAWRALYEYLFDPFHWEKSDHSYL